MTVPVGRLDRARLRRVALGEAPPDLLVTGAEVVNVYTGELVRWDVAVAEERVAAVGPDLSGLAGPGTERIDAAGRVLVPGFIDSHTHLDVFVSIPELLREAIPRGLTTVITEMGQFASVLGLPGARWFAATLGAQPIHAFATAPMTSHLATDDGAGRPVVGTEDILALLDEPTVLGLGEVYWHRLVPKPEPLLPLIERALALGKIVEGHTAGARGPKLLACAALGVGSCHEPITAAEALERLRLGMHVQIREGSIRRDLEAVIGVRRDDDTLLRRAALASDGMWPPDLLRHGYMDAIVQKAIDLGLSPIVAFQMASLNAAERFGLDGEVGGIAPPRSADFMVLPDLRTVRPELVVARGRVVARDGRCLATLAPVRLPAGLYAGPRVGSLDPGSFRIPASGLDARVRVIGIAGAIVTAEEEAQLPVRAGAVVPDPGRDCLLAAVLDRRGVPRRGLGFVRGYGLRNGAFAATTSFDTADLVAVGASAEAVAAAARRVVALGGGIAVVDGLGAMRAELPLPLAGVASPETVAHVAQALDAIEQALRTLGCELARPLLTLQTLTFSAIPALRLTTRGLLSVKSQQYVPVMLSAP